MACRSGRTHEWFWKTEVSRRAAALRRVQRPRYGKCLPCPGGPDHPFKSPQSYTGEEPAALRAREHSYDPFAQVHARLEQFELLGHRVDKAELIVMGGTMTARTPEYQEEFVSRCIEAMNTYPGGRAAAVSPDIQSVQDNNETSAIRCVAITFETRPDWCRREHVDRMLHLGVTKVELGVQHVDDAILLYNRRGCTVADTVEANTLLRDAGMKVGFHMMPNLPGSDIRHDKKMFETLFSDPRFRPDFLKIYPTLVTPYVLFEVRRGTTPGKKMMGLTVVYDNGTPIGWPASMIRNVLRVVDFFPLLYGAGLLSMLINRQFKRLGDLAAGTLVVYVEQARRSNPAISAEARPLPVPLAVEEQRALLDFAGRSSSLAPARVEELAEIISDEKGPSAVNNVLGYAHWLARGR